MVPFEPYHLGDTVKRMRQYSKRARREIDLADASLYWRAAETDVRDIVLGSRTHPTQGRRNLLPGPDKR